MAVSNNDERRKFSRVAFAADIRIDIATGGETVQVDGSSRDLSLKGVFIHTKKTFELESVCEINIHLTGSIDEIVLKVKGRVARVSQNGIGLIFDSMDVDSYSHLKNIVQYNSVDDSA